MSNEQPWGKAVGWVLFLSFLGADLYGKPIVPPLTFGMVYFALYVNIRLLNDERPPWTSLQAWVFLLGIALAVLIVEFSGANSRWEKAQEEVNSLCSRIEQRVPSLSDRCQEVRYAVEDIQANLP